MYFGYQSVRSVINGAIFNRLSSNLFGAHNFKISPPAKEERSIAANLCPFWGNDRFWGQIFSPIFFLHIFFFAQIFFTQIFFSFVFGTFFFF